jgi:hypothetical protein
MPSAESISGQSTGEGHSGDGLLNILVGRSADQRYHLKWESMPCVKAACFFNQGGTTGYNLSSLSGCRDFLFLRINAQGGGVQMLTKAPKGTKDILPQEVYQWHYIEDTIRDITGIWIQEIRTPVFEHTELFERGWGTPPILFKRRCTLFRIRAGGASP